MARRKTKQRFRPVSDQSDYFFHPRLPNECYDSGDGLLTVQPTVNQGITRNSNSPNQSGPVNEFRATDASFPNAGSDARTFVCSFL